MLSSIVTEPPRLEVGSASPRELIAPALLGLLEEVVRRSASDLHMTVGERPKLRIEGEITAAEVDAAPDAHELSTLIGSVLTASQRERLDAEDELDFSFEVPGVSRFRGNLYRQRGRVSVAIRRIPLDIHSFADLELPPIIERFSAKPRGLVLVTGPTGSGKSTTLAAMIDRINREERGHILTVEDPIEFVHQPRNCIVRQREVGADTRSFAAAVKSALRQDPDVVLVGEMRDLETIQATLTIAETGHLAFATLHTNSCAETINRIIDVFPAGQQAQIRTQLALVLEGVITQVLLPRTRGGGRVAACEVMVCTPAVRACIREDKVHQIQSVMQAGKKHGMQTMNDALHQLVLGGVVSLDVCVQYSPDAEELLRMAGRAPAR